MSATLYATRATGGELMERIECPHCGNADDLDMSSIDTTFEQGLCVTVTFNCRCSATFETAIWQLGGTWFSGPELRSCAGGDCSKCHPEILAELYDE